MHSETTLMCLWLFWDTHVHKRSLSIVTDDPLEVCGGVCIRRDPALCQYFRDVSGHQQPAGCEVQDKNVVTNYQIVNVEPLEARAP